MLRMLRIKLLIVFFCIGNIQGLYAQYSKKGTFPQKPAIENQSKLVQSSKETRTNYPNGIVEVKPTTTISTGFEPLYLEKSLLWEISGNGLEHSSYLFGTIHQICNEDFIWLPYMQAVFDRSAELVMEMDLNGFEELFGEDGADFEEKYYGITDENTTAAVNISADSVFDFNTTIRDTELLWREMHGTVAQKNEDGLIKEKNRALNNTFPSKQPIKDADPAIHPTHTKPVSAKRNVSNPDIEYGSDCEELISYESRLTKMAKAQKKKISGLETLEEQLALVNFMFENLEDENATAEDRRNAAAIMEIKAKRGALELHELIATYQQQDIAQLLALMPYSELGWVNLNAMLFERNKNWMEQLPNILKGSSKFIAVGAGHLPGQLGLIHLLRKKGYRVKPILK